MTSLEGAPACRPVGGLSRPAWPDSARVKGGHQWAHAPPHPLAPTAATPERRHGLAPLPAPWWGAAACRLRRCAPPPVGCAAGSASERPRPRLRAGRRPCRAPSVRPRCARRRCRPSGCRPLMVGLRVQAPFARWAAAACAPEGAADEGRRLTLQRCGRASPPPLLGAAAAPGCRRPLCRPLSSPEGAAVAGAVRHWRASRRTPPMPEGRPRPAPLAPLAPWPVLKRRPRPSWKRRPWR